MLSELFNSWKWSRSRGRHRPEREQPKTWHGVSGENEEVEQQQSDKCSRTHSHNTNDRDVERNDTHEIWENVDNIVQGETKIQLKLLRETEKLWWNRPAQSEG